MVGMRVKSHLQVMVATVIEIAWGKISGFRQIWSDPAATAGWPHENEDFRL